MMAWILSEAWPYIAGIAAGCVGLLYAFMRGRSSAEQDVMHDERKAIDKAKGVHNEIASEDDDAIRDRANAWVRGGKR